jgi:hypothetical protein
MLKLKAALGNIWWGSMIEWSDSGLIFECLVKGSTGRSRFRKRIFASNVEQLRSSEIGERVHSRFSLSPTISLLLLPHSWFSLPHIPLSRWRQRRHPLPHLTNDSGTPLSLPRRHGESLLPSLPDLRSDTMGESSLPSLPNLVNLPARLAIDAQSTTDTHTRAGRAAPCQWVPIGTRAPSPATGRELCFSVSLTCGPTILWHWRVGPPFLRC